ncbi:RES family NAD+ phosphorylase [Paraburkholderia humisilvae]|uniref:RES domain-containing protein n=1 Tax=Paraburkholderia humisilvae TaxID=627669 RepID=A0A6J5F973_9BURK|nr:RES family NAD+ phosphorylase [Paraburkholderia humisilvae]CAB3774192.1 hypothetical protein LMG29542_07640 [Paraburkholderia humisilvae]
MLKILVHVRVGDVPETHVWIEAEVPNDVMVERQTADSLPAGWDAPALQVARAFGGTWHTEARSAVLVVPSVVALQESTVHNPAHRDAARLVPWAPQPDIGDERLFTVRHLTSHPSRTERGSKPAQEVHG